MAWPSLASFFALSVAGAAAFAMSGASQFPALDWDTVSAFAQRVAGDVALWAEAGYKRKPAVMIGLVGLVTLPVIALIGLIVHRMLARPAPIVSGLAAPIEDLPRFAWLELDERSAHPVEIRRELMQIGRESDNDVCLSDSTVHRYHAVIERSGDLGFVITDVSGPQGNGMRINGAPAWRARLEHGDVVELGKARLKFATAA